jgi:hypothetical protein
LDLWDNILGIAEIFNVVLEAFIMLLPKDLQCICYRWTLVCALEVPNEHGALLVPRSDRSFGQVDEPRSGRAGQCHGKKVGLNPIISSSGLNDGMINLNKLFRIVGPVILINVAILELVRPLELFEWSCQSMKPTFPNWGDVLC